MSTGNVVTSQPVPSAPPSESELKNPSAPMEETPMLINGKHANKQPENVVVTQPISNDNPAILNNDNLVSQSMLNENVVVTQPMLNNEKLNEMLEEAEEKGAERERRRQRDDFCCFVCADTYYDNTDSFCWYFFCRMLCNGCGHCCEGCAHCTDSCCEGCAECCNNCCNSSDGNDGCDGCCGDGGDADGCDGCCDGGDAGDCDCDCSCFD